MQQKLFETAGLTQKQGLVISKAGKKRLTKNQEAFNKLTQKIEKLHKDKISKELQFDTALTIYGNDVYPKERQVNEHRGQLLITLWDVYKSKKLSKADQQNLKMMLKSHVDVYISEVQEEPGEAFKKMVAELTGESYESLLKKERELFKTELEQMFEEMEMDVDLTNVDMDDENAVAEKMAEITQKLTEKEEKAEEESRRRNQRRKKSAKQVENERIQIAVDESKQKNISTIYKQLAKLFHPDLEHDEERRAEKELLMKELTAAYETRNLHTLLTLELKWIHKENDHLESLTEEKLAVYLQILREQARELEEEINSLFQQPRYQVLAKQFGPAVQRRPVEAIKMHLKELESINASLKRDLVDFKSSFAVQHIKSMINEWKEMQRRNNTDEELFRMMF